MTVDLRGFGQSNHITEVSSMDDFADDVHRVILKVAESQGYTNEMISARYVLVGWSFGGMVVMTMATKYNTFYSRLVLVASGPMDNTLFPT